MARRADKRYEEKVTLHDERGRSYRKSIYDATRAGAAAKARALVAAERRRGGPEPTVRDAATAWLTEHVRVNRAPRTTEAYHYLFVGRVEPAWGDRKVGSIAPRDVSLLLAAWRAEGLAPGTVARYRANLAAFFAWLVRQRLVAENPVSAVETPGGKPHATTYLEPDEARGFLRACAGERYGPLFTTALILGLRSGELRGLRWEDYDDERADLYVRRQLQKVIGRGRVYRDLKTARSVRALPVPPVVAEALLRQRMQQEYDSQRPAWRGDRWPGAVFTGALGAPFDPDVALRHFRRVLGGLGIAPRRLHDLRHSCASILFDQGWEVRSVMEQLGHANVGVTANIYLHVTNRARRGMADTMQKFVEGE